LDTDKLKMALGARKVSWAFEKQAPEVSIVERESPKGIIIPLSVPEWFQDRKYVCSNQNNFLPF